MLATTLSVTVAALAVLALPIGGLSQATVPEARLGNPIASLPQGFTSVRSIVELSDGRVLIADNRERRVGVADISSGSVRDIGRIGQGPGEFTSVTGLFPLGLDSVLMFDGQQRRSLTLVGDQIVATSSSSVVAAAAAGGRRGGADSLGFLLSIQSELLTSLTGARATAPRDSIRIAMVRRSSNVAETVAKIGPRSAQVVPVGGTIVRLHTPVLAAEEDVLLFSDGWLAIVRLHPYRVDWRNPQGGWTFGSPLPFQQIEIDDRERASHREYLAATAQNDVRSDADWPNTVPPFHSSARHDVLVAGPRGLLLIKRAPTADRFASWYDVVDRRGALIARLVLQVNQRIAAFGRRGVYVVSTDQFDLQHVHLYAIPSLP